MTLLSFTRRRVLAAAAFLGPVLRSDSAAHASPFLAAVHRAEAADAAFLRSGRISVRLLSPGVALPPDWRAYRDALRLARSDARMTLYALTPATPREAEALVAYLTERAARCGVPGAAKAARRHLRETFSRPYACGPP